MLIYSLRQNIGLLTLTAVYHDDNESSEPFVFFTAEVLTERDYSWGHMAYCLLAKRRLNPAVGRLQGLLSYIPVRSLVSLKVV